MEPEPNQTEPDYLKMLTDNPLNNVLVLEVMFDHLPKKDWKSARLVNTTWHSTLQPRWRDGMMYKLGNDDLVTARFLEQQHPANNPNDPLQLGRHPIRNISTWFYMNKYCILPHPGPVPQTRFWDLHGQRLKSLQLADVQICEGALLKKLLFELTPSLEEFRYHNCLCGDMANLELDLVKLNTGPQYVPPTTLQKNLKVVDVDLTYLTSMYSFSPVIDDDDSDDEYDYNYNDYKPQFPISWIEFFSIFPKIQKLVLDIDPEETERPSDFVKLLKAVDVIRKANNNEVLNITELRAGFGRFNVTEIQSLLASLPISVLYMYVNDESNENIILVLQTLRRTLRQLTIVLNAKQGNRDLPTDVFPQDITKLSLHGPLVSSFEFLLYLPNLEELDVERISCVLPYNVDRASVAPLVNLKKLKYSMSYPFPALPSYGEMEVVTKLMINVTSCDCIVRADGYGALCQGLINLKHLKTCLEFDSEDFFVENLIKLKCLRSLEVTGRGRIKITDKSVFEGFLRIPSLVKIKLSASAQTISEEGFQAMGAKLSILE